MSFVETPENPVPANAVVGFLTTSDGVRIRFARFPASAPSRGTVILLQGRAEFIEKYVETARDRLLEVRSRTGEAEVTRDMLAEWPSLPVEVRGRILASAIDAVMVKPAASGSIENRVRILWRGEAPHDLPRRGHPRPIAPFEF